MIRLLVLAALASSLGALLVSGVVEGDPRLASGAGVLLALVGLFARVSGEIPGVR